MKGTSTQKRAKREELIRLGKRKNPIVPRGTARKKFRGLYETISSQWPHRKVGYEPGEER